MRRRAARLSFGGRALDVPARTVVPGEASPFDPAAALSFARVARKLNDGEGAAASTPYRWYRPGVRIGGTIYQLRTQILGGARVTMWAWVAAWSEATTRAREALADGESDPKVSTTAEAS